VNHDSTDLLKPHVAKNVMTMVKLAASQKLVEIKE
jgi:hypothetical protein